MKRLPLLLLIILSISFQAEASHITGGEMYYKYRGFINGMYQYDCVLRLLQRCGSGRQFPNPTIISIFDKATAIRITDLTVPMANSETIRISNVDPCITNPPDVCYEVAYYTFSLSLPASAQGYVMASQVNYRINGITNLASGYSNVGATYTAEIPGTATVNNGPENTSAQFTGTDLVIVCADNNFTYSFAASDEDGDQLIYSFCDAYASTSVGGGTSMPTNPPPFPGVPYGPPFSGNSPLGPNVHIDPTTGIITGIAPPSGIYVVTVCVQEIRNGQLIAIQRKDVQINITDCSIASASLLPEYQLCKNTQTITIANQSNSPLIVTSEWEFMDNNNNIIYTATGPSATYTFPSIGLYKVKLVINRGQACTDSTTSLIRVFPGFVPDFSSNGICYTKPTLFFDNTTSVYGIPDSWSWDFGESTAINDISAIKNPVYTYPSMGLKNVRLIATDTRGCRDTIYKTVTIIDKPPVNLAFRDTLICVNDNLTLRAIGSGSYSWSPNINIVNANTATPTVSPVTTIYYYVDLDDNGCKNRDSVKVNVVSSVTLQAMPDTIICRGDTIQLRVNSNGLQYSWTPAAQFVNPNVKNPLVFTSVASATYQVRAIIGGCSSTDNIDVNTIPYPFVNAGADLTICYNTRTQLYGVTNGSSWTWSPANLVSNTSVLNPFTTPPRTTDFVLSAFDTKGCPKPGRDTVRVTVRPKMYVSAGNDTAVVINQPLQLHGSGGINYIWTPSGNLSAGDISNPVAIFSSPSNGIKYKLFVFDQNGCKDSAFITVKVYKYQPTVFVPSGFTPNNDGLNDLLRPLAVGIADIEYFNIYNRWGQLVYTTTTNGQGWDGSLKGVPQSPGTFVWMVKATDYHGKPYMQKGMVTLIR